MPKFFVKQDQVNKQEIKIEGKDVNHIKNVLRKKQGEKLNICITETKQDCIAEIKQIKEDSILCNIVDYKETQAESKIKVTIFQGIPKSDKMELIIQKAVELGVYEIYPVEMKRSIVKIKDQDKKISRWQKISEVASKQCGRNIIPKIKRSIKTEQICEKISQYDIILVAYEEEKDNSIKNELQKVKQNSNKNEELKMAIVIGPEGGLENKEVEDLKQNGAKIVTLGKRILRTETVALNVLSNIMYEFEQ